MTATTALPTLQRLARGDRAMMRLALGCQGAKRLHAPTPGDVPDLQWSHCPLDLLDAPHYAAIRTLSRLAHISPLAGWPDRYASWAVDGVMTLRQAED